MAQDSPSSTASSVTLQGLTEEQSTASSSPSTIRSEAAPPDTMASSAQNIPSGRADDGAQPPPRAAAAGAFRGPETPEPPDPDGRDRRLMRMFEQQMTILQQMMKADEDDTIEAVLEDLREPIRKSVQEHSHRRLVPLMRGFGPVIVENFGHARDNFVRTDMYHEMEREIRAGLEAEFFGPREEVMAELRIELEPQVRAQLRAEFAGRRQQNRAELRRELEPHIRAELEAEFAGRREQDLAELRRELEHEIRAQVETEFAGRRKKKLAELAEVDAEIDRKKRAGFFAPPVTIKREQDDQPSRRVRIKREPNDEPLSLFLDWDDQNHQNGENQDNNQEIKQEIKQEEDVGPSGIKDDSVIPWPFPDDPRNLPEDEPAPSIHEEGYHTPWNYSDTTQSEDRLSPLSPSQGWTDKDDNRAYRRLRGLTTDGEDSDMEYLAKLDWGTSDKSSIHSSQAEETYSGQEDVGKDLGFENFDGSTNYSVPEDDAFSDQENLSRDVTFGVSGESSNYSRQEEHISSVQEHLKRDPIFEESGQSSNFSRQEGDTSNSQADYGTNSPGTPIKTESFYSADDADDERPASKARKSIPARGTKRKGRAVFDDPRYHCIENGQIKRTKINGKGHFESKVDRDTSFFNTGGLPDPRANNFNADMLGDYDYHKYWESITNAEASSASGGENIQAGRVKRSMPKKRHLSRASPIQYQEEEEDEEL